MKGKDIMILFLLAALWGASFLFIRVSVPVLGPFVLIELRVLLAGITLVLYALISRHPIHIFHKWRQYLVLGASNAAIPFTLISSAELHLSASLAAILNATTPMFTVGVAWLWAGDPFSIKKLAGVILGILGVSILVGWNPDGSGTHIWLSVAFSLLAALSYGMAGVFSTKYFEGEKPTDMAIGQQLAASLVLLPFAAFTLPHQMPSTLVIFSVLFLAILCTAVAYLFFFALIHRIGAVKTLTVTLLVPVFGVIWGSFFLDEQITIYLLIGLIIILSSVALVVNFRWRTES